MTSNGHAVYENTAFEPDEDEQQQSSNRRRRSSYQAATTSEKSPSSKDDDGTAAGDGAGCDSKGPLWDSFQVKARAEYHEDRNLWQNLRRFAKVVTIALCFLLIIFTGTINKLTMSLITTNLRSAVVCDCDKNVGTAKMLPSNNSRLSDKRTVMWAWALILVLCFPYSVTFLRHLWKSVSFTRPRWYGLRVLLTAVFTESFHSIGVVILTTVVLPKLDMFHSVGILLGLGIIPSLLRMLSKETGRSYRPLIMFLNTLAFIGQLSAICVYPIILFMLSESKPQSFDSTLLGGLVSLILMSAHWWPNYFDDQTISFAKLSALILKCPVEGRKHGLKYRRLIGHSSSIIQVIVNAVKIVITMFGVVNSLSINHGIAINEFVNFTPEIFQCPAVSADGSPCPGIKVDFPGSNHVTPIYLALVNISAALVCYYIMLHAIKSKFSPFSYILPLILLSPIALALIVIANQFPDSFNLDSYPMILFNLLDEGIFGDHLQHIPYWLPVSGAFAIWFLSQLLGTFHSWTKPRKKIPSSDSLFLIPMFDAECLEQSLLYNRKLRRTKHGRRRMEDPADTQMRMRSETAHSDYYEDIQLQTKPPTGDEAASNDRDPHVTHIYFCATMWHENKKEMLLMLKSVLRMDFDHYQKRSSQKMTGKIKPDYYNFETHIFFDDAFQAHNNKGEEYKVNSYVKQLIEAIPESVRMFYPNLPLTIDDPVKVPTPYGGRLEWDLPSRHNKIVAHLKDKTKIRHKKRWSQVMYMYYFLGELLMNNPAFSDTDKEVAAKNTYLLALDGDVDFKPEAVLLLVDMMKKNDRVGAACGRIHPIGSGPLVWYQKFEYAIAHWLQKATEHVLGCVLCSPGCFSLFRAEALMQENVMAKYATTSTKARHYLQFDQGEDRWLCTLLLQAGYKVEYNAAADALTFAPEGFDEFFNQRRRWGPSTMANILDLIMDAQHVIRTNSNMSLLYIIYQAVQFFASIIGPGTIFLMITGALAITVKLEIRVCFVINLIPNLIFIIVSFFVKSNIQLKMAKLLAIIYALVMGLVLISIILDIRANPCSPTAIFFFTVAGTFILSACIHPQEFTCVLHGVTYYILIPCMYMLLIVYSFININNVSWGTRETVLTPTEQQQAAEKAAKEKASSSRRNSLIGMLASVWRGGDDSGKKTDGHKLALGDVCQIVCCPKPAKDQRNEEYWQINKKLDKLTNLVYDRLINNEQTSNCVTSSDDDGDEEYDAFEGKPAAEQVVIRPPAAILRSQSTKRKRLSSSTKVTIQEPRNDLINPSWAEDTDTGSGQVQLIGREEIDFWDNFIIKYLAPLDKSPVQQEKVEQQLLELRMNVNFAFFLTNAMFITIVFTLQENSDELSFPWPCGVDAKVEPFSLVFIVFFIAVLVIQFIGMVVHRLGTFWHIMATTKLFPSTKDDDKQWESIVKHAANVDDDASDMDDGFSDDDEDTVSTISQGDDEAFSGFKRGSFRRRSTARIIIARKAVAVPATTSLEEALKPKLEELSKVSEEDLEQRFRKMSGKQRRQTVKFLKNGGAIGTPQPARRKFMSESQQSADAEENAARAVHTQASRHSSIGPL